jgi:iron complex outermembrane receptor protein
LTPSFIIGADYTHITKSLGASYTSNGNIAISTYDNFKAADIFYGYVNFSKFISNIWQTNINFSGGSFSYDISATSSNSVNRKMFYTTKANNLFKLKSGLLIEWNISYTSSLVTGIFKRAPYYYSDLGLSKSFFNNKLNVKWAVSDLFNTQRINMHIDYQHVVQDNFLKQESRFVNLTIRWKIGKDTIKKRTDKPSTIEDIRKRIN